VIDESGMRSLCNEVYAYMVAKVFGDSGVAGLFCILETIRELYRHVEPERVKGQVIVFFPLSKLGCVLPASTGELCGNLSLLVPQANSGILLEVRSDGRRYSHPPHSKSTSELAHTAVVYEYRDGEESFFAGTESKQMIKLVATARSQFAVPTFFNLREALKEYALSFVRYCGCPILKGIWADAHRLFLKPAPEGEMRRSLTHFLKVRLGASYEVRPEQVMDESHPVDIKVTFSPTNRLMILEIKWMGDSLNEKGNIGTQHRDARAKEGAEQLAGYLDQNRVQAPLHVTHGYYVIVDARRRGLRANSSNISRDDGLYFADKEVSFDPEYHRIREDFDPPYRMFAEPECLP